MAPRVAAVEEDVAQAMQLVMPEAGAEEMVSQTKLAAKAARAVARRRNRRRPRRGLLVLMQRNRRRTQA